MPRRVFVLLTGSLLVFASAAPAADEILLRTEDVSVLVPETESIPESKARNVLHEARKAFARVANAFGVTSESIFRIKRDLPAWYPPAARDVREIQVVLTTNPRAGSVGLAPYMGRLRKGRAEIHLAVTAERKLSADESVRLWRQTALAILAHSVGDGAAPWLKEGLADVLSEDGGGEDNPQFERFRDELAKRRSPLPYVLSAHDPGRFSRLSGRATSWAFVRILLEARPVLVSSLLVQSRYLGNTVSVIPGIEPMREEHTEAVLMQLKAAGADPVALDALFGEWVAAGCPLGPGLRQTEIYRALRKLERPKPWRVELKGNWGRSYLSEFGYPGADMTDNHPLIGGTASWRLPFESHMEAFAGVRDVHPRNSPRKDPPPQSYVLSIATWGADAEGSKLLPKVVVASPAKRKKRRFLILAVSSPRGLGYTFTVEVLPK